MNKYFSYILIFTLAFLILPSCANLDEEIKDGFTVIEEGDADPAQLVQGAYNGLRNLQTQEEMGSIILHTTDEMAGPTRGRDWDDAGIWRVLHTHSWTTAHAYINRLWKSLNTNSFSAFNALCAGATGQTKAEATFLRALHDFYILDTFGKLPRRACGENLVNPPSQILGRAELPSIIIGELEAEIGNLPEGGNAALANKDAAYALLAKIYLNKAVYAATGADGGALEGPYSFDAADMDKVIQYCDNIINSGRYSVDDNYFDNFVPDNGEQSSELIFVSENTSGAAAGNVRCYFHMTTHYNQNPSGWNGFVALTDLYNLFEEGDKRVKAELPLFQEGNSGLNAGFLVGQQYDVDGNPLQDRTGSPLSFTPDFKLTETGSNLEVTGIRCIKYPVDYTVPGDLADNDFVIFRFADVWLMKAEAMMRKGNTAAALDMVNTLRGIRGASQLGSLSEQTLLDERGRELYWEGWRRNDQIRFGTYLGTWQEKPNPSSATRLLFCIPGEAISTNPNLEQNPGY
ncbi:MAG: RagB/SusD family nutrient uptake outer membrane protein [Chitinophagales bacterium]